ncbi:MAG: molybdenum cofactor synthesis domain-containing protein [Planctomycetota bacterium]|nr:molybdenum cofactor synthesis domain-containing protein [Planctomycetota bacterium]
MNSKLEVVSVNISRQKGTVKEPVDGIDVDSRGIVGDAHAGAWHRQVSLLSQESIDRFAEEMGRELRPGEFAENIAVRGLDFGGVAILDRFRFGEVVLEVTQIGKKCHGDGCAIYREVGRCVMPKEGLFTRVVSGGRITPGDQGHFQPRPLKFLILTLSDRAAAGEYEDRSGPKIAELLQAWLLEKRWHAQVENRILPDDADKLRQSLITAVAEDVDVVVTTGGTGVGPRDITPEVVSEVCEKLVPGIMENIRIKFGSAKPNALLSRSVAGAAGKTQIYALPGSVKAVTEYMGEILKTLEHIVFMLHGLDVH